MLRLDARPAAIYLYLERMLQSHISRFELFASNFCIAQLIYSLSTCSMGYRFTTLNEGNVGCE
jgi:hypothetical protein